MAVPATVKTLPGRYAKFLTALAGNALVYADITYGATNRWVELATAAAVAFGVLAVPNTTPPERPPDVEPAGFAKLPPSVTVPRATGMHLDPRQIPTSLMQPAMDAGHPPEPPAAYPVTGTEAHP